MLLQNFKIGVNENGIHFRDEETGVMFTLIKAENGRFRIAVCLKSGDKKSQRMLRSILREKLKGIKAEVPKTFPEITPEKCYISNSNKFQVGEFVVDGICLLHRSDNKKIGVIEIVNQKIPKVLFDLRNPYGCEEAVKDFFELCSPKIKEIYAGTFRKVVAIKNNYSVNSIRKRLRIALEEGVLEQFEKETADTIEVKETVSKNIRVFTDGIARMELERFYYSYYLYDSTESANQIEDLLIISKVLNSLPHVSNVYFRYYSNNRQAGFCITKANNGKILKSALEKEVLTV